MAGKSGVGKRRFLNHLLFWTAFIAVNGFVWGYCGEINATYFSTAYQYTIALLPILVAGVYFNLYILLPRFFLTKKYTSYFFSVTIVYLILSVLVRSVLYYGFENKNDFTGAPTAFLSPYYLGKIMVMNLSPVFLVSSVIKLWQQWYLQQKLAQDLQKEKLDAELKFLKTQIHPHFLFNTLNNIYSLALTKSNKTPQMLLKLSDLMSYMLYDSQENKIPLEKEIKHIQDYVDLERLRYGNRLDVQFIINGSLQGKFIAPLVLIPFVENAFKHGPSAGIETSWIRITLNVTDDKLWIRVENSKTEGMPNGLSVGKGIGLVNVQRRLNLLYPDRFDLATKKGNDQYAVDLKLTII